MGKLMESLSASFIAITLPLFTLEVFLSFLFVNFIKKIRNNRAHLELPFIWNVRPFNED